MTTKYKMVGVNLPQEELKLAKYLMEREGITPSDLVRGALIHIAGKHIPEVHDWEGFKIASVAVKEREEKEVLEEENKSLRVEIQALRALIPDDKTEPRELPKRTTVVPEDDPIEFQPMRYVCDASSTNEVSSRSSVVQTV